MNKASIAIEAVRRSDQLFVIERWINGKPPDEWVAVIALGYNLAAAKEGYRKKEAENNPAVTDPRPLTQMFRNRRNSPTGSALILMRSVSPLSGNLRADRLLFRLWSSLISRSIGS